MISPSVRLRSLQVSPVCLWRLMEDFIDTPPSPTPLLGNKASII